MMDVACSGMLSLQLSKCVACQSVGTIVIYSAKQGGIDVASLYFNGVKQVYMYAYTHAYTHNHL